MATQNTLKPAFGWTQLPSGSFRRPLDGLESFLVMVNNSSTVNEHWAISINLRLSLPARLSAADAEACLKHAWLDVCHKHPALTGRIELGTTQHALIVHPLSTSDDDASWLSRTFFVQHENPSGSSGSDSAFVDHRPFTHLRNTTVPTCHWLPASQELHIRCQHWRIDGIGMLMLGNTFMSALASVALSDAGAQVEKLTASTGTCTPVLTPCLYDLINIHLDEATTPALYQDAADSLIATFIQGVPSIGLPTKPGSEDTIPGGTARQIVTFSIAQTELVIAACKTRKLNVASAVHAALIRVTANYPQHPLAKSYTCLFPVDMRRHLPPSSPVGVELITSVFSLGLPLCVSDVLTDGEGICGRSFADIAAQVGAVYTSDLASPREVHADRDLSMLKLVPPFLRRTTKLVATPPPPQLPPLQNPDLSSLGKIAEYFKPVYTSESDENDDKLEVTDFWLGIQIMDRHVQCHVWTFREQLNIQGCFNTSFYERTFVSRFLEKVKAELLDGLGIV